MALIRVTRVGLCCLLALSWALSVGCGIKSVPIESAKLIPGGPLDLRARPMPQGVEVTFGVPGVDRPDQRLVEAVMYYGYLPLTGDPDCPPCPPRLTKYHDFDLTKVLEGLGEGSFSYLDTEAPLNKQAVYQVILVDAAGRKSKPSFYTRAYRVAPPAIPEGLLAKLGEGQVDLSWQPVATLETGEAFHEPIGYKLIRKGPDGERVLNERPLSAPSLTDKTIMMGQTYSYRVLAVRTIRGSEVDSQPSSWVVASIRKEGGPQPASELAAVSQSDGVYLRFTPSPDQDTAGYAIERQDKKDGPWARVNPALWQENTYVDRTAQEGAVYFYRVVAVDEAGRQSTPSQAVEVRHRP